MKELEPWVERIKTVGRKAKETYAVTNNHNLGKAAVNALEITALLRGEAVRAPEPLQERYPELREFTDDPSSASA